MSHKARSVKFFNLGDVVNYSRRLFVVVSIQRDLFGRDLLCIYSPKDRLYKTVSSDTVQCTDYYFVSDDIHDKSDLSLGEFVRPDNTKYFYITGLSHFDGLRDTSFIVRKVDPSRRMVYLVPTSRYKIGVWVTFSEFVHCFTV